MQLYEQNPLEKIFIFTLYPNYTLALNNNKYTIKYICENHSSPDDKKWKETDS